MILGCSRLAKDFASEMLSSAQGTFKLLRPRSLLHVCAHSGPVRPRQGTEICNFRARRLHWIFLNFLQWSCPFSPGFLCTLVRNRPQMWRQLPEFGRRKKRRILSRLWLSWFFQSRHSLLLRLSPICALVHHASADASRMCRCEQKHPQSAASL